MEVLRGKMNPVNVGFCNLVIIITWFSATCCWRLAHLGWPRSGRKPFRAAVGLRTPPLGVIANRDKDCLDSVPPRGLFQQLQRVQSSENGSSAKLYCSA